LHRHLLSSHAETTALSDIPPIKPQKRILVSLPIFAIEFIALCHVGHGNLYNKLICRVLMLAACLVVVFGQVFGEKVIPIKVNRRYYV